MRPMDVVALVATLAVAGAVVVFVAILIWRAIRVTVAGRRADRAFREANQLREAGKIDVFEAVRRINEAHERFQREA